VGELLLKLIDSLFVLNLNLLFPPFQISYFSGLNEAVKEVLTTVVQSQEE